MYKLKMQLAADLAHTLEHYHEMYLWKVLFDSCCKVDCDFLPDNIYAVKVSQLGVVPDFDFQLHFVDWDLAGNISSPLAVVDVYLHDLALIQ